MPLPLPFLPPTDISLVEENSDLEQRIAAKIIPKVESFLISREVQGGGNDSNGALKCKFVSRFLFIFVFV